MVFLNLHVEYENNILVAVATETKMKVKNVKYLSSELSF
jgi:hypothetical protein